jgi:hypothetical protein
MKLCVLLTLVCAQLGFQSVDKAAFYSAMASASLEQIDKELTSVTTTTVGEREAYKGALLMRKAGLLSRPKEKLAAFRSGATLLESCLAKDSTNVEYHFLRLMIQEHAPRVVHYDRDQEQDSRVITRSFRTLSPVLQKAILDYCPHSKRLHQKELNG